MKKISSILALGAFACASVFATGKDAWHEIENPGEIVPTAGEFAVLISAETRADVAWRAVAEKLSSKFSGEIVVWEKDVSAVLPELQKRKPRYVAVVARAEEIDRVFVAKIHRISREIEPDFYGDAIFGIVSGARAKDAAAFASTPAKPLVLTRGFGTTNFDQQRFRKSFFITDWRAREFVETKDFVSGEKTSVPEGVEVVEVFANKWSEIKPEYVLTASHATEFNLEMPFGEGLIASAGDKFYCFSKPQFEIFKRSLGNAAALREIAKKNRLKTIRRNSGPTIWIAAGNCLFGDALRTKNSMAITAISAAGVNQLVGYTVPSWFGEGGWGTNAVFFDNHPDTTVAQAWFFNNQEILSKLPEKLRSAEIELAPDGFEGPKLNTLARTIAENGIEPTREIVGRFYDRDVVAFYGNPFFRASFDLSAPSVPPWNYRLFENGNARKIAVSPSGNKLRKGDFRFWFPRVCEPGRGVSAKIFRSAGAEENVSEAKIAFTKNFVFVRDLELSPGDVLEIFYTAAQ